MKRLSHVVLLCGVVLGAVGEARAGGDVDLAIAIRFLRDPIWSTGQEQPAVGLNVALGRKTWPVRIAGGYSYSSYDNSCPSEGFILFCFEPQFEFETEITEWDVGVARSWRPALKARPFLGGGASYVITRIFEEETGLDDRRTTPGLYVSGGVRWGAAGEDQFRLNQGFEIKALFGTDVTIAGSHVDADYFQIGYVFGPGW